MIWGRQREAMRVQRDADLEAKLREREAAARTKGMAFARKQAGKIAAIQAMCADDDAVSRHHLF